MKIQGSMEELISDAKSAGNPRALASCRTAQHRSDDTITVVWDTISPCLQLFFITLVLAFVLVTLDIQYACNFQPCDTDGKIFISGTCIHIDLLGFPVCESFSSFTVLGIGLFFADNDLKAALPCDGASCGVTPNGHRRVAGKYMCW